MGRTTSCSAKKELKAMPVRQSPRIRPKAKAAQAGRVRQQGRKSLGVGSSSGPSRPQVAEPQEGSFDVLSHVICSQPSLQVMDNSRRCWRPAQLYQSLRADARIVIWYGGDEYEGLPPSLPYKLKDVQINSGGRPSFTGRAPGQLLDSDGEPVPTRAVFEMALEAFDAVS
ncbi:unnamed protein product [Polarella glacialis]|nr:unnamed protein product [Polarella glacialis]